MSFSMVCKISFCSEFPNIPDKAGRKMRRMRRRTYPFHANAKSYTYNADRSYTYCGITSELFYRAFYADLLTLLNQEISPCTTK